MIHFNVKVEGKLAGQDKIVIEGTRFEIEMLYRIIRRTYRVLRNEFMEYSQDELDSQVERDFNYKNAQLVTSIKERIETIVG